MLQLELESPDDRPTRLLCIGAHPDDIEIGCGGTILQWIGSGRSYSIVWVVFTASGAREAEARESAAAFLEGATDSRVLTHAFRDGYLPYDGATVKDEFEALKLDVQPDLILTHQRDDRHQDHRLLSELTWNTFRDHLILEYEIPKFDGGLLTPNLFVPIQSGYAKQKIDMLMTYFGTQRSKRWFNEGTFDALMRLRGVESASPSGLAEGFHAPKVCLTR